MKRICTAPSQEDGNVSRIRLDANRESARTVESIGRKLPCRNQIENPARSWVDPVSNFGRGEKQERRGFPVTSGADKQEEGGSLRPTAT